MKNTVIVAKRIYAPKDPSDGLRVLVDRLWPRGVTKEAAALHAWLPDVAPTAALRSWFRHDPGRYDEFCERYLDELHTVAQTRAAVVRLAGMAPVGGRLTLLFGARDEARNNAVVLREHLLGIQRETD